MTQEQNVPKQTPLADLLRSVPKDYRGQWPIQWSEDGRETGHAMCPVGRLAHEAADRIEALEAAHARYAGGESEPVAKMDERIQDLCERLRATDSKERHLSLSEQHELCDFIDELPYGLLYAHPVGYAGESEVIADQKRLVRELDVLINGEAGAAEQASLCDIVAQVKKQGLVVGYAGSESEAEETIQRLRGQLQNCVNHLEREKRSYGEGRKGKERLEACIQSANKCLYETLHGMRPAPAVPDEIDPEQVPEQIAAYGEDAANGYADGWNAYREAMLTALEEQQK